MKAGNWTTWEKYLPSANVRTKTSNVALCLKPWDRILPEEDVKDRMSCKEPLWRTWEKYLSLDKADAAANLLSRIGEERQEMVVYLC